MNTIIFSTDVDLLQSSLIAFKNETCLYVNYDCDINKYLVYCFDLIKEVDSWIDLDGLNDSCDANYTNQLNESDYFHFTQDVCWYHGADNFDCNPTLYTEKKFLKLIESIKNL